MNEVGLPYFKYTMSGTAALNSRAGTGIVEAMPREATGLKQSELFTRARREFPKDEVSVNAQLLIRAGFVEKLMAGVYSFLPLGMRVMRNIERIIREEMEDIGGTEIKMPALQPRANWETTKRWDEYDTLFRFTSHYTKTDYVLGPTHEEVVVPLVQRQNLSYKDFPVYVYQIQTKFRDEVRVKSGLLRGREFTMKDLYSFHVSDEDLDAYYETVKNAYRTIFKRVGIGNRTYLTFASGGTFSKYSHEFQMLTDAGEDTIYLCEQCKLGVNKEIAGDAPTCPECGGTKLKEEKAIEVGNIFKLKTKYSVPFGFTVKDGNGKERNIVMGCYGIGLDRLMGAVVEARNDEKGIVWPEAVAPFTVHLLPLGDGRVAKQAEGWYKELLEAGVETLYDDRALSPGEKFAEADLIGTPYRAVVSEKTIGEGKLELKRRNEEKAELVTIKELIQQCSIRKSSA